MDAILKFIDKMVAGMPSSTLQIIRLSGLLVWLIIATIAVTYAWSFGSESVPPSGQDTSQAAIRRKIEREKNLKNPPDMDIGGSRNVKVPSIGELRKGDPSGRSFYPKARKGNELSGDGKTAAKYPGYVNQRPDTNRERRRAYEPPTANTTDPGRTRAPASQPGRGTSEPSQYPPRKAPTRTVAPSEKKTVKKKTSRSGAPSVYQPDKRYRGSRPDIVREP